LTALAFAFIGLNNSHLKIQRH